MKNVKGITFAVHIENEGISQKIWNGHIHIEYPHFFCSWKTSCQLDSICIRNKQKLFFTPQNEVKLFTLKCIVRKTIISIQFLQKRWTFDESKIQNGYRRYQGNNPLNMRSSLPTQGSPPLTQRQDPWLWTTKATNRKRNRSRSSPLHFLLQCTMQQMLPIKLGCQRICPRRKC